ncbi:MULTISPECIES: hypothetical protein [unclassified Paracoccus (in: a-proteobacteria)]|uniref:hypothetical protein n=1 Tax=unclassified Paracoccus (in: a-proteobacteria) TaxID=2688777 RepID=UPI0015FEF036|nr:MULTISPECIES: hypothetical protein [unclassified Paracoccus (in: a-proteobacteria)]MBB1490602.1 hypothetical protein [Paracoccus sp. MC1854]MBB1499058.1 hypothetical protein [Paracoccus sp. MC1862]QQO46059.1 hypothetical protein JGR78_07265 [Paracoccus sp. MC1862]
MTDTDTPSDNPLDDLDPSEVRIETVDAFHLGGTRYSASFELTDVDCEFSRSFLLDIDFGETLTFTIRLQIEDAINSHATLVPDRHVVLELGGLVHDLTPAGDSVTALPEGVLRRVWHLEGGPQFVFGDHGVAYIREVGAGWNLIQPYDLAVLRDIHGTSAGDVHACGHGGLLLRLEGRAWVPLEIPDQRNLYALEVSADGALHFGGAGGTAYALVADELIALEAEPWDYFGIRSFKGRRYWTDPSYGISVQEGRALRPFRNLGQGFFMHASAEKLVISGWKEVFVFDGQNWEGFEMGYDGNIFLRRLDMADYGG